MTLRLTVQRSAWMHHVEATVESLPGLVPVIKGNGYGFGRSTLHPIAAGISDRVCVGTVYELDGIGTGVIPVVLTPTRVPPPTVAPILTVGSLHDVAALAGWHGRVLVKLRSSMQRYGVERAAFDDLVGAIKRAGLTIDGYSIHLPLAGDDRARRAEIEAWLPLLSSVAIVWISHMHPDAVDELRHAHPVVTFLPRVGTALWHGSKQALQLTAEVIDTRPITAGDTAGYRLTSATVTGTLVMVGAGTAHGVTPLADGRSPFHFARRRLTLLEAPHMHTSMVIVPAGDPCPMVGERVDVQRPLISTMVDQVEWLP